MPADKVYQVIQPEIIDLNDPDYVGIWLYGQTALGLHLVTCYTAPNGRVTFVFEEAEPRPDTRELLAAYAHEAWSGWMRYLWDKAIANENGTLTLPVVAVERWRRQMTTAYADLPEDEKRSDRKEADEMLAIVFRA